MNAPTRIAVRFVAGTFALGLFGVGAASAGPTGKEVVGTWTLVSATTMRDGKKEDFFGPSPQGRVVFDEQGNYTLVMVRSDLPKFASDSRSKGSADENAAVVQGSIAHFGQYSYDEKEQTYTLHIKSCTFPNWNGASQTRRLTVNGDDLHWVNAVASTGAGTLELTLKRLK